MKQITLKPVAPIVPPPVLSSPVNFQVSYSERFRRFFIVYSHRLVVILLYLLFQPVIKPAQSQ